MALVEKTFGQVITFSRASSATFFNRFGVLSTATTNSPRFDYDPVTLIPRGILIEEQRTNLLTYSEQFDNAAWVKNNITVAANTVIAPNGTLTGDTVVMGAVSNDDFFLYQVYSGWTSGVTYTQTWYVKSAGISWVQVAGSTGTASTAFRNVNIVTGALGNGNYAAGSVTATSVGNGWYRISVTETATSTSASGRFLLVLLTSDVSLRLPNVNGDGTSGIYIWGAQLEVGAFSTSYIPTVASTVTRSADVANINTLSPWFNASEGTLFVEGTIVNNIVGTTSRRYAEFGNSGNGNEQFAVEARSTTSTRARMVVGGVATTSSVNYNALGTNTKIAGAYGADGVTVCVAGLSPVTAATSLFGTVTSLFLGTASTQISATNMNGYLRRVIYYPRRLSNAELQSITA